MKTNPMVQTSPVVVFDKSLRSAVENYTYFVSVLYRLVR